jgi:hypothetical protein
MTDQISWNIAPQTLKTDSQARALERLILADCPGEDVKDVRTFTVMLSCTRGLDFNTTTARAALRTFKQFIEQGIKGMSGEALWEVRQEIPLPLWWAWIKGFNGGQELFDPDPAELPLDALTEDQKAEAETPGSPLT